MQLLSALWCCCFSSFCVRAT